MLVAHGDDVDVDLPLALRLLVRLAGGRGHGQGQGQRRWAHDLGLRLGQQPLLGGVGVLVGEQRGQQREGSVAGRAAELGAGLGRQRVHLEATQKGLNNELKYYLNIYQ